VRPPKLALLVVLLSAGCIANPFQAPAPIADPQVTFEGLRFDVEIDATHHGVITAIVFANESPQTWAYIRNLTARGYYDGREFTRVIPGFVIQQVDRSGGSNDDKGTIPLEGERNASFSAGAFGIARGADPSSGGPEFFVMDFATSRLYRNFTAWAQVTEGLDVVHAIARVPVVRNPACSAPSPVSDNACFLGADALRVGTFDSEAVVPPKITKAEVVNVTLPASVAARYPLVVGPTQAKDAMRLTLEWPRNLAPRAEGGLTWYVYSSPDATAPQPDVTTTYVVVQDAGGAESRFTPAHDPADARILHWRWTPLAAGNYTVVLRNATSELARAGVQVPVPAGQP